MFIIIDGIDGAGKGTILSAWKAHLREQEKKIFDIKSFWKQEGRHPELTDIGDADIIFTAEPTNVGIGAVIRNELISKDSAYPDRSIAEAFALDRLITYKKFILPLRNMGKIILQDRGVSTSLCYQSIQMQDLSMTDIAEIEGNAFALSHAPDHLVLCDISVETALERLGSRIEKDDNAIFEKKEFLIQAQQCFQSEIFQTQFTNRGTHITHFSCEPKIDIMKQNARNLLDQLLS